MYQVLYAFVGKCAPARKKPHSVLTGIILSLKYTLTTTAVSTKQSAADINVGAKD